jgi:hypothetical protein
VPLAIPLIASLTISESTRPIARTAIKIVFLAPFRLSRIDVHQRCALLNKSHFQGLREAGMPFRHGTNQPRERPANHANPQSYVMAR